MMEVRENPWGEAAWYLEDRCAENCMCIEHRSDVALLARRW